MQNRSGIFAGDDPFEIARIWLKEAERTEINDANAIALATVDADGLPNARMVLLKEIEPEAFVFYTNYGSAKGREIAASGKAAFVMHWKSLRRQIRVRGATRREEGPQADAYFASRSLQSRLGAWASHQSRPLQSRASLMAEVAKMTARHGHAPARPPEQREPDRLLEFLDLATDGALGQVQLFRCLSETLMPCCAFKTAQQRVGREATVADRPGIEPAHVSPNHISPCCSPDRLSINWPAKQVGCASLALAGRPVRNPARRRLQSSVRPCEHIRLEV